MTSAWSRSMPRRAASFARRGSGDPRGHTRRAPAPATPASVLPRGRCVCPGQLGPRLRCRAQRGNAKRAQRAQFSPAASAGQRGGHRIPPVLHPGPFSGGRSCAAAGARTGPNARRRLDPVAHDCAPAPPRRQSRNNERKPCVRVLPVLGAQGDIVQHIRALPHHVVADDADVELGGAGRPAGARVSCAHGSRWRPVARPAVEQVPPTRSRGPDCGVAAGIGAGDG